MASKKVVFVSGDDWEGLYIDGKLVLENHSLEPRQVLDKLGIKYERRDADAEWLADTGNLPQDLKDVEFDE